MATLNVGAMAARLGLDPSEFMDKMKGVQGFNGFVSGQMAREWKKAGRDGQEGMRLIDEALGIHVARPVARIVSETFPSLGKAMSGILPGVAFSALGFAILEFGEHIAKKMEEAKQKQEAYNEAVRKGKEIAAEASASHEQSMDEARAKQAKLTGDTQGEGFFKARVAESKTLEELAKYVDKVTASLRQQQKAAAELMPFWLALEHAWHAVSTTVTGSAIEQINAATETFRNRVQELAEQDRQQHTRNAEQYIKEEHDKAKAAYDAAVAASKGAVGAHPLPAGFPRAGGGTVAAAREAPDVTAARKQQLTAYDDIAKHQKETADQAKIDASNARMEAGAAEARELRSSIEAVQRLVSASQALASSEELAASAAGKGSAATILATAAAEAQKKIQDLLAEQDTKYLGTSQRKNVATKQFQAALETAIPAIRAAALAEQTFKGFAEYNKGIAEFNTHLKERSSELDAEAEGHSKVAAAQAKELAGLIPLEAKLVALQALEAGHAAAPEIGPPTANQAGIAAASAELAGARAGVGMVNARIQAGAFQEELEKLSDEMKSLAGAEVSPWAKIDAQVEKLTDDLKADEFQALDLHKALVGIQNVKIAGEFEKLVEKIKEADKEMAALTSGSPFAKLDADAQKIAHEFGITLPADIATLRQGLIALNASANVEKGWLNLDSLNASGAKMMELRQQMESLRAAAKSGAITDDATGLKVALSPDALAAVRREMLAIADEQNKIALQTGDIDAGILAWATDLQKVQSAGEITFQALSEASKGFEENASKSLFAILEEQRGGHLKLIHDLEAMWSSYFKNLAMMGMKQGMDKLLAPVGKAIGGAFGKGNAAGGVAGATGAASLTSAGASLHGAAVALLSAATALRGSAAMGGGAGGAGGYGPVGDLSLGGAIPFFASGGDATPGSNFISGEAGAEEVSLDGRGGAHITPLGVPSGGDTHITNDFRGTVMTDDLMRRAEALTAIHASEGRMMGAMPARQREINLRKRN